jgi:pimeloyl-ACP methyl ester carboxylesterase
MFTVPLKEKQAADRRGGISMHYRTDYCAAQLSETPQVLKLGEQRLHYQAYAQRSHDPRPPLLLLGGAFQSFRSFAAEVSELLEQHPVILLDLPSQGGNLQLVPELSLEQLADLIATFAEELDLPPLMPIGLSYGSALAALFAARHPTRCARVLLAGITAFGRPGARLLLQEGLALLAEGRIEAFAHGALTGLLNPLRLEQTGVAPVFRKALLRQIQRLSAADIERYRQNSQRLLDFQGFHAHPSCPTLVLAGEYDHFTQPWEHAHFAAACAQASCALIHNADHLAQFEQREACASLYNPFLRGEALPNRSPGSSLLSHQQLLKLEKRFEPRQRPNQHHARLQHAEGGEWPVEISELGFFGGLLQGDLPDIRGVRGWKLLCKELPAQPLLPLRHDANGLAFVFPHSEQQASQALTVQFQPPQPLLAVACA